MPKPEDRRNMQPEFSIDAQEYEHILSRIQSILLYLRDDQTGGPNANADRLGVTAETIAGFNTIYAEGVTLYNAYKSADRSRVDIDAIRMWANRARPMLNDFTQTVKTVNKGKLTAEDHRHLGIHVDETTNTPIEPLEVGPDINIVENLKHGGLRLLFSYPTTEAFGRHRMQHGQHVQIQYALSQTSDMPEVFPYVEGSTRTRKTIEVPEGTPAGTFGFLRARYATTTEKYSPWSDVLRFIVN